MEYEPLTDSKKMEEKQLTPQESVQMIEKMLEQTRKRLIRGAGIPSLIWGYVTFATSLLILFVYPPYRLSSQLSVDADPDSRREPDHYL